MRSRSLLVSCAVLFAVLAHGADVFEGVEYVSGKDGFPKKVKGQLAIDEKEVRFSDGKGKVLFAVPMGEIDKAEAGTQQEGGSFGRKMALGIFASKTEEYLHVESHNGTGAEGLVFKVKKKTGPGMATKIRYWAEKAKAPASEPPAPSSATPPSPPR